MCGRTSCLYIFFLNVTIFWAESNLNEDVLLTITMYDYFVIISVGEETFCKNGFWMIKRDFLVVVWPENAWHVLLLSARSFNPHPLAFCFPHFSLMPWCYRGTSNWPLLCSQITCITANTLMQAVAGCRGFYSKQKLTAEHQRLHPQALLSLAVVLVQ